MRLVGSGDRRSCLVVGAGVIGLAVAWELAKRDVGVTVLERDGRCGQGTSAAAAGMLAAGVEAGSPGPFFELCRTSSASWDDWAVSLEAATGVDCELDRCGLLRVTTRAEGITDLEVRRAWQLTQGVRVSELLSLDQLRSEVPGVSADVVAGLLYLTEGHVHSHRVLEALENACRGGGVVVETGVEVAAIQGEADAAVAVATDGRRWAADHLVVTTGPWSGRWLTELGVGLALEPVRGQIAAVLQAPREIPRIVFGDHGYVLQKRSGLVLVGATEESVGFDAWPTLAGITHVAHVAGELIPRLTGAQFAHAWAGLRPHVKGGPLLGRVPTSPRVLLATGHHRNGILLAPTTAELIAAAVLDGSDPAALGPFRPGRPA